MFSFLEASQVLGASLIHPDSPSLIQGVSIDTRSLQAGELFAALKGRRQDGHDFLEEAFRKGAAGALIRKKFLDSKRPFRNLIPVSDPQKALAQLAAWYRSTLEVAAIAVTGSVGKTSTKEFLSYILRQKYSVLANQGNFNNHLGLPLTLFRLRPEHRFCVAELGANHPGEIDALAKLLCPTAAILTQVSPAHLEGFGSLEGVYRAKLELLENLPAGSAAILPDDDPYLFQKARRLPLKLFRVGFLPHADYPVSEVKREEGHVSFRWKGTYSFSFPGLAGFLARNAAMALALADQLGFPVEELNPSWTDLKLPSGRFQERDLGRGVRAIDDGYNANPASFETALAALWQVEVKGKKILVFADMLELGKEERRRHEALGRRIALYPFHYVAAYGRRAKMSLEALKKEKPFYPAEHFSDPEILAEALRERLQPGDTVLFKASRGMKIEDILGRLQQKWAAARQSLQA